VYLTEAERIVLLSCFDTRPPAASVDLPSGSADGGKKVTFAADRRAMKGSVSHGLDTTNNNGERTCSHRELAFATGRYSGSRFAVAVSLLAVHMAVRGRECEYRVWCSCFTIAGGLAAR
jgi:hypothetical protein